MKVGYGLLKTSIGKEIDSYEKIKESEQLARWVADAAASRNLTAYEKWIKRPVDLMISLSAATITAPLVATAALLIKLESPGPALFRQIRVGRNLSEFTVLKLRTMRHGNNSTGQVFAGNPDTTRFGAILRRFKIDELPQLYNVIQGDMSLVGPRPFLTEMVPESDENGRYRFLVRPGLTGLAQTNGNVALSWPSRWRYDRDYVENVTIRTDAGIMLKTIAVILTGEQRWVKE